MSNENENENEKDDAVQGEDAYQANVPGDTEGASKSSEESSGLDSSPETSNAALVVKAGLGVPEKQSEALDDKQRNAIRERLESTDVQAVTVMAFEALSLEQRIEILGLVRSCGSDFNQKQLPVLSGLLVATLAAGFVSIRSLSYLGWILAAGFAAGSMIAINIFGKKDARRETNYLAWVKALEEADARANKKLEKGP